MAQYEIVVYFYLSASGPQVAEDLVGNIVAFGVEEYRHEADQHSLDVVHTKAVDLFARTEALKEGSNERHGDL